MKKLITSLLITTILFTTSCTDGLRAKVRGLGSPHRVTLYSGGHAVREWTSTGAVSNEQQSDGFYFEDAGTHHLIRVSGTVVIETLN